MRRDLAARFAHGDESAVAQLYAEYGGAVFTVAMSILRDRDLAAEATQQTFIKAWRAAGSYDPKRRFAPWIYAIARRTSIDIWRAERRRQPLVSSAEAEAAELPPGIEQTWEMFEVRAALDVLSDEERSVVELTHYEGYTHTEAAEVLGVSVGTVKSRSHRAHRRLAEALSHLIDE